MPINLIKPINMEGIRPNAYDYGGHPAQCLRLWRAPGPYGASPTQPYKCSQYVKIKVKVNVFISALAKTAERNGVDVDFKILTALKGWVGLAP